MDEDQLAWAVNQVRSCRRISLPLFNKGGIEIRRKADDSPVTVADMQIEKKLRAALSGAYSKDVIIGEEYPNPQTLPRTYWTVDPIDGTRAFSRGLPFWGTLLGRVVGGRAVLGVCDYPALNTTLYASADAGAFIRERGTVKPLAAAGGRAALNDAVILHGGSRWWRKTHYAGGFAEVVDRCYLERAYGDCYGYLWLFKGLADAVIECGLALWDIVPLAAVAQSVGMGVYGPESNKQFDGAFTVVSKPALAKELVRTLTGNNISDGLRGK